MWKVLFFLLISFKALPSIASHEFFSSTTDPQGQEPRNFFMQTNSFSNLTNQFLEARTAQEVKEVIQGLDLPERTYIFFDVDDTLITPRSTTFRAPPYNQMIDRIKQKKDQYPNYPNIISNWRLQRKIMPLGPQWPQVLKELQEKFIVHALTKMDRGPIGNIPSMEEWRYQELTSLELTFSLHSQLELQQTTSNDPLFHRGIFLTGPGSKAQVLEFYKSSLSIPHLVMVDDRREHLEDIENFCKKESLPFTGIWFKGLEILPGQPDPELADFQEKYLLANAIWLEDEEARQKMKDEQN